MLSRVFIAPTRNDLVVLESAAQIRVVRRDALVVEGNPAACAVVDFGGVRNDNDLTTFLVKLPRLRDDFVARLLSSAPVGLSARMSIESLTMARAIAACRRSPPEVGLDNDGHDAPIRHDLARLLPYDAVRPAPFRRRQAAIHVLHRACARKKQRQLKYYRYS